MRILLQFLSAVALIAALLPGIFFLTGSMELKAMKDAMLTATAVWFVVTPFWMGRDPHPANERGGDGIQPRA